MNRTTKATLILATVIFGLATVKSLAYASDEVITNCQYVYGGGQICGTHTPVKTAGESSILFTLATALYGTGLTSLVLGKNAAKFVPFLD
jgi:hypothetical protein